jgi:ADP-ribose pyrophosphatase
LRYESYVQRLGAEKLFEGKMVAVARRRYRRADGSEVEREVVEHPGSVAIVAHDERFVYLVRQPREAVEHDRLLEIPAGTIDPGESPLTCAKRELAEEVGMAAERWSELQTIYTSPGYVDESIVIFAAARLSEAKAEADEEEQIEIVRLPVTEIDSALPGIADAKTLVGLLLLKRELTRGR